MTNAANGEKSILEAREITLDRWMYVGMVGVLAGVIIETIPEFLSSHKWLVDLAHRVGGSSVAIGLLVEFIVDIKARKCRARLKEIADQEFAEVLTRATKAELAAAESLERAAEANLARVKLEATVKRRSISRKLSKDEEFALIQKLREYSGQRFTLRASRTMLESNDSKLQEYNAEQSFFVLQLQSILSASGWISENIANLPDFRVTKGLTIFLRPGEAKNKAPGELAIGLSELDVTCHLSLQPQNFPVPLIICVGLL